MLNFNIFSLRMKDKIIRDVYSTQVVTHDIHDVLLNAIVTEHLLHPKKMDTTSYYNILCFDNGEKYQVLFFTKPCN